jgi:hypothetical protein
MTQKQTELSHKSLTPREISQRADKILAEAGYDIFGREDTSCMQTRFELRMQTGAYCSQKDRTKWKGVRR